MLIAEKERGAGILMCTHVLDTAEKICDRFYLLDQGALLLQGTLEELQEKREPFTAGLLLFSGSEQSAMTGRALFFQRLFHYWRYQWKVFQTVID